MNFKNMLNKMTELSSTNDTDGKSTVVVTNGKTLLDSKKTTKKVLNENSLIKTSLKDIFEAQLSVQPMPNQPNKQTFLIKDPANPTSSAITTSDPAVVAAAKNGTLDLQKPGAAPTANNTSTINATGSNTQIAPMQEDDMEEGMFDKAKKLAKRAGQGWTSRKLLLTPGTPTEMRKQLAAMPTKNLLRYVDLDNQALKDGPPGLMAKLIKRELARRKDVDAAKFASRTLSPQELDISESWDTDTKVKSTGQYKDKTIAELKSMLAKLKKSGPHAEGSAENKKMKQIMFAIRSKKDWKGGIKEADMPNTSGVDTMGAGLGKGRSQTTFEAKSMSKKDKFIARLEEIMAKKGLTKHKSSDPNEFIYSTGKRGKMPLYDRYIEVYLDDECPGEANWSDGGTSGNDSYAETLRIVNRLASGKELWENKMKKKIKENISHKVKAARLEGRSHGLKGHGYAGNNYHDIEEQRAYHEGYKMGLDECYGMTMMPESSEPDDMMEPIIGLDENGMSLNDEDSNPAKDAVIRRITNRHLDLLKKYGPEKVMNAIDNCCDHLTDLHEIGSSDVSGWVNEVIKELEHTVDEGNAFTAALAKTPHGGKFSIGGKTYIDKSNYNSTLTDDYAFEAWDRELNNLLKEDAEFDFTGGEKPEEDYADEEETTDTSISSDESDKMLNLLKAIKDLGAFNNSDTAGETEIKIEPCNAQAADDIKVIDDHDGMMALMKKMTVATPDEADTYELAEDDMEESSMDDEEDFSPDDAYEKDDPKHSGYSDRIASLYDRWKDENKYKDLEETETVDQKEEMVAKTEKCDMCDHSPCTCDSCNKEKDKLDEWANLAGKKGTDAQFEQDIEFMTKVISGGLNKQKSTGQTTTPVIADLGERTNSDAIADWKKLAGIK
jgi:hypothetical protein